jgi:molybdate transport system substrate-binding protein
MVAERHLLARYEMRALLLTILALFCGCEKSEPSARPALLCYVGGTMRPVIDELLRTYEQKTGQKVELDYGDSGLNLIKIQTAQRGDLYVAHDPFLAPLMSKGLGKAAWTVASITPVIVVLKGNPQRIRGVEDLARPGCRLGLTDPEYSMLGHICPVIFDRVGLRSQIERNVDTNMRMGGQVANAVAVGNLDAAIVWNAVAHLRSDRLDVIEIPPRHLPDPDVDAVTSATFGRVDMSHIRVFVATLESSKDPEAARSLSENYDSKSRKCPKFRDLQQLIRLAHGITKSFAGKDLQRAQVDIPTGS